jgi:hypothetical protein
VGQRFSFTDSSGEGRIVLDPGCRFLTLSLAMKKIFTSADLFAVTQLKDALEREGIACVVQNEISTDILADTALSEKLPELWVENDADSARAEELVRDWDQPVAEGGLPWKCPQCGEESEAQFTACWKCGTNKP